VFGLKKTKHPNGADRLLACNKFISGLLQKFVLSLASRFEKEVWPKMEMHWLGKTANLNGVAEGGDAICIKLGQSVQLPLMSVSGEEYKES